MENYSIQYHRYKQMLEQGIISRLCEYKEDVPGVLFDSMKYSMTNGGKRIRGVLLLAACHMLGVDEDTALDYACAVEMIHSSSLIHDDLPCMDDDTIRRGKPCNHVVFGEANALYAGVGLLNLAYEMLLLKADSPGKVKALYQLSKAAGVTGIVKGQTLDILYEGKDIDFDTLKTIHACKTGALIKASALIPAILANSEDSTYSALEEFGNKIGIAFQIIDDVLDVTSTSQDLGKTSGKDEKADKLTYVKVFGVEKAKEMAKNYVNEAISGLDLINYDSGFLQETAKLIIDRRK